MTKKTHGDGQDVTTAISPEEELEFVSEQIHERFPYRQIQAINEEYKNYWSWLRNKGKDPDRNVGIARTGLRPMFARTRQFHLHVWNVMEEFTLRFSHTHADEFEDALDKDRILTKRNEPYTEGSKRKLTRAVQKYFLYRSCTRGGDRWVPGITFHQTEYDQVDYLTLAEREKVYNASLAYEDLGRYGDLSPTERERRKGILAQKLGKPKDEVTPGDFEALQSSWKIVALISVSLDIGARPILINRIKENWYKPGKGVIQIPKVESPKNDAYWEVGLSTRSIQALDRWLEQRVTIPKYDDTGTIWLNREGNPYNSGSLNYLLDNLLEEAEINPTKRKLTWYSIRRSTGTYLTYFQSLAYAKQQLRHKSLQSTLIYTEIPVEARKDALDQLVGAFSETGVKTAKEESSVPLEVIQCI